MGKLPAKNMKKSDKYRRTQKRFRKSLDGQAIGGDSKCSICFG